MTIPLIVGWGVRFFRKLTSLSKVSCCVNCHAMPEPLTVLLQLLSAESALPPNNRRDTDDVNDLIPLTLRWRDEAAAWRRSGICSAMCLLFAAVVVAGNRGPEGQELVVKPWVAMVKATRLRCAMVVFEVGLMDSWFVGPKPSSLIQNKKDQTHLIRYGRQPSHTLMTRAALNQTRIFRSRYVAMWLAKT